MKLLAMTWKRLRDLLITALILSLCYLVYLSFDYGARMPPMPDAAIGRTYPLYPNHALVYVTAFELEYFHWVQLCTLLVFVAALVTNHLSGRRRTSQPTVSTPPAAE